MASSAAYTGAGLLKGFARGGEYLAKRSLAEEEKAADDLRKRSLAEFQAKVNDTYAQKREGRADERAKGMVDYKNKAKKGQISRTLTRVDPETGKSYKQEVDSYGNPVNDERLGGIPEGLLSGSGSGSGSGSDDDIRLKSGATVKINDLKTMYEQRYPADEYGMRPPEAPPFDVFANSQTLDPVFAQEGSRVTFAMLDEARSRAEADAKKITGWFGDGELDKYGGKDAFIQQRTNEYINTLNGGQGKDAGAPSEAAQPKKQANRANTQTTTDGAPYMVARPDEKQDKAEKPTPAVNVAQIPLEERKADVQKEVDRLVKEKKYTQAQEVVSFAKDKLGVEVTAPQDPQTMKQIGGEKVSDARYNQAVDGVPAAAADMAGGLLSSANKGLNQTVGLPIKALASAAKQFGLDMKRFTEWTQRKADGVYSKEALQQYAAENPDQRPAAQKVAQSLNR